MRDMLYVDSPTTIRMWASNLPESVGRLPDILLQTHDLSLSGVPIIAHDHSVELVRRGCFVTVVSAAAGELQETYKSEQIPLIIDPLVIVSPEALHKLIGNYDLVFANTIMAWRLVLAAKALQRPVLWVIQEGDFGVDMVRGNHQIREALNLADRVVFASPQTRAKYDQFASRDNFSSLLFGVDPPHGLPVSPYRSGNGRLKVVHIGSIERRKGQDTLIQALKRLAPEVRAQLDVSLIGRVLETDYYVNQLKASSDLPNVHWLGSLPPDAVWRQLAESDILVCSSRDETGPLVIYEAMSLGKAVVSTPVGAVPELIRDAVNGIIFASDDAPELARCLERLSASRELIRPLGKEALATYQGKLTKTRSNQGIVDLMNAILGHSAKAIP
jgi:glycosyltransferase involved in cell wall biosynthesis